jgi:hypothetical protein
MTRPRDRDLGRLQVPPISRLAYPHRSLSSLNVIENFRAVEDGVDAAVPTHRTRPQVTWKTAKSAVFHSVHTDYLFLGRRNSKNEGQNRNCKCAN